MESDRGRPPPRETNWRLWALLVAVVLAIVFIAVNSQDVKVDFVFFEASVPLIFALLIATVLGIVIGYVVPRVRASRRRRAST